MISPDLALASIVLCGTFGIVGAFVILRRNDLRHAIAGVFVLSFAVLAVNYSMEPGVTVVADPGHFGVIMLAPSQSVSALIAGGSKALLAAFVAAAACNLWWRRKLDQETLQLETALENMPQGICMFDAEGRVTCFNQRYAKMMGFRSTSLKGRHLLGLLLERESKGALSFVPEELYAAIVSSIRAGNVTKKIVEFPPGNVLRISYLPIQIGGWVTTYEDITEQHNDEMQRQIAISSIEQCPVCVTIADATKPDLPLIYVNRMFLEMTGYTSGEVIGRNCRFLQGPATDQRVVKELRQAISVGKRIDVRIANYRKDGTEFLNHAVVVPVRDGTGRVVASVGFQSDVTHDATHHIEVQRQKMEALGRMMGGVAHEINNMLQPIALLVQQILDRGSVVGEGKLELDIVLDCTNKAALIISDLLSFSKPVTPTSQVHDPIILLNQNLPIVRQLMRSEIVLSIRIDGSPPPVKINRISFAQIILNLAINAIGAMNGRGELTIVLDEDEAGEGEAEHQGRFVRLLVIDTGCGMDKATVDRAFEPFFTTKPVGQGTGLGLPVVYGLVHEMGGTIAIDSELGIGTTVTILIPRHNGEMDNGQNIDS